MSYVTKEQIERAKQIPTLDYLLQYESDTLVRVSRNTYCTVEHDSLKIDSRGWHWYSRGTYGKTALDYLVAVENVPFVEAVEMLVGREVKPIKQRKEPEKADNRKLILPQLSPTNNVVTAYLMQRGIEKYVINYCIENGIIRESLPYHNVIFIGNNDRGEPAYAAYRSCNEKRVLGDCTGSNKAWSFRIADAESGSVHVFESAIDLLSYASLALQEGTDFRKMNMLSLAGVYPSSANKVPVSLSNFLQSNKNISTIYLHLDNDEPGRNASKSIMEKLNSYYKVVDSPPTYGKDVNDFLVNRKINRQRKEEDYER